jgi:hypothetical protein
MLDKVSDIVGIKILDFIIVDGQGNAVSMREEGGAA